jgi:hypothetical protein
MFINTELFRSRPCDDEEILLVVSRYAPANMPRRETVNFITRNRAAVLPPPLLLELSIMKGLLDAVAI